LFFVAVYFLAKKKTNKKQTTEKKRVGGYKPLKKHKKAVNQIFLKWENVERTLDAAGCVAESFEVVDCLVDACLHRLQYLHRIFLHPSADKL
jgi:hypothetical protein